MSVCLYCTIQYNTSPVHGSKRFGRTIIAFPPVHARTYYNRTILPYARHPPKPATRNRTVSYRGTNDRYNCADIARRYYRVYYEISYRPTIRAFIGERPAGNIFGGLREGTREISTDGRTRQTPNPWQEYGVPLNSCRKHFSRFFLVE